MNYETYKQIIIDSKPEDWLWNDEKSTFTYKDDLNIWLKEGTEEEKFKAIWTRDFPGIKVHNVRVELYYGCSLVEEKYFISVDNFKAILPIPLCPKREIMDEIKKGERKLLPEDYKYIRYEDYQIARILNPKRSLREFYLGTYIRRFTVTHSTED